MEGLNTASRPSIGLPPINSLDSQVKREDDVYQRTHSGPAMVSPLYPFPGAPRPYSTAQWPGASAVPGPFSGLPSPPTSRRTSDDVKDPQRQPPVRSLPSIHELTLPPPPSAPPSTTQPYFPPTPSTSVSSETRARAFSVEHINNPAPSAHYSQPRSPYLNKSPGNAPPPPVSHAPADNPPRPPYSAAPPSQKLPTLHPIQTTHSPPGPQRPNPPYSSYSQPPPTSAPETPAAAPHSAGSMNPPQYGYSAYPSSYPLSAPGPNAPESVYPPTAAYSAPPRYPPAQWQPEAAPEFGRPEEKKGSNLAPYGATIKRHLEHFDLEASLNEMSEGAGRVAEFSRVYREKAHHTARTGITAHSIPSVGEVDDMLTQSEKIQRSLHRMREVVVSHQQANVMDAPREAHYRQVNGYEHDAQNPFHEEGKGAAAFGNMDSNKRPKRGRAAPPGRCHSCNRAETPEWRRGPDGARTLCNACGLHYAKMSRKMNGKQPTNSQIGWQRNENIRPKSLAGNPQ